MGHYNIDMMDDDCDIDGFPLDNINNKKLTNKELVEKIINSSPAIKPDDIIISLYPQREQSYAICQCGKILSLNQKTCKACYTNIDWS